MKKARIYLLVVVFLLLLGSGSSWPTRRVYWPMVLRSAPDPELVMPTPAPPIPLATLINDWRVEQGLPRLWPEVRLHRSAGLIADQVIRYNCDEYLAETLIAWALHVVEYEAQKGWAVILCGEYPTDEDAFRGVVRHGGPADPDLFDMAVCHIDGLDFWRRGGRHVTDVWVVLAAQERWP